MQFNKDHITISHIIIFSKTFNQSTSAALLQGRCSTYLGTGYIRVFAVTVGVSATVIDGPKVSIPFPQISCHVLLSRENFST